MLRCSSAALSKNTVVAAAIARPARTIIGVCAGIGRENGALWRVFRLSAQGALRRERLRTVLFFDEYGLLLILRRQQKIKIYLATVQETANSSAWNHIFNFRRRGPPRRRARNLLPLCHSRECTKEPISAFAKRFKGKVRSYYRAELRNIPQEKMRGSGGSSCRFCCFYKLA